MEIRCSTEEEAEEKEEEEEGHEIFSIRMEMWSLKSHPVGLTLQLTLAGETGLHTQQQTLKTN